MSENKLICIPESDTTKRFLLGQHGKKGLLAIGLNPSTANEQRLDPTSRNIKTIAQNNGFDGWWITNLYPHRTPKPSKLPKTANLNLAKENLDFIKKTISNPSNYIACILCCWGNNIEYRDYLKRYADQLLDDLNHLHKPTKCIGFTLKGNPYHPAPMGVNRFLGGINNIKLQPYQIKN